MTASHTKRCGMLAVAAGAALLGGCRADPVDDEKPFTPWVSIHRTESEQLVSLFLERGTEPVIEFHCSSAAVEFRDDRLVEVRLEDVRGGNAPAASYEQDRITWLFRPESEKLTIVLGNGVMKISDQAGHSVELTDAWAWRSLQDETSR